MPRSVASLPRSRTPTCRGSRTRRAPNASRAGTPASRGLRTRRTRDAPATRTPDRGRAEPGMRRRPARRPEDAPSPGRLPNSVEELVQEALVTLVAVVAVIPRLPVVAVVTVVTVVSVLRSGHAVSGYGDGSRVAARLPVRGGRRSRVAAAGSGRRWRGVGARPRLWCRPGLRLPPAVPVRLGVEQFLELT